MASYTLIGDFGRYDGQLVLDRPYVLPGDGYPAAMLVQDEVVLVRGGAGTAIVSVDRGQQGTDSAAHASGTAIADISPYESTTSGIVSATVTLSSADILDLHNTPVTVVAAPGAGKRIDVHRWQVTVYGGTTDYGTTDGWPHLETPSGGVVASLNNLFLTVSGSGLTGRGSGSPEYYNLVHDADANEPVRIRVADGNLTGGDRSMAVTVWYSVEDVPA